MYKPPKNKGKHNKPMTHGWDETKKYISKYGGNWRHYGPGIPQGGQFAPADYVDMVGDLQRALGNKGIDPSSPDTFRHPEAFAPDGIYEEDPMCLNPDGTPVRGAGKISQGKIYGGATLGGLLDYELANSEIAKATIGRWNAANKRFRTEFGTAMQHLSATGRLRGAVSKARERCAALLDESFVAFAAAYDKCATDEERMDLCKEYGVFACANQDTLLAGMEGLFDKCDSVLDSNDAKDRRRLDAFERTLNEMEGLHYSLLQDLVTPAGMRRSEDWARSPYDDEIWYPDQAGTNWRRRDLRRSHDAVVGEKANGRAGYGDWSDMRRTEAAIRGAVNKAHNAATGGRRRPAEKPATEPATEPAVQESAHEPAKPRVSRERMNELEAEVSKAKAALDKADRKRQRNTLSFDPGRVKRCEEEYAAAEAAYNEAVAARDAVEVA